MLPATTTSPLRFLTPVWFTPAIGWAGLALAWRQAIPLLGPNADRLSLAMSGVALALFIGVFLLSLWRAHRYLQALREDLQHPMRHPFMATLPLATLLLATAWVGQSGPTAGARALWWMGSLGQLTVTVIVLGRWWRGFQNGKPHPQGLNWAGVTPVLILPVVGNVLAPLAGVSLGHADWAAAQFGIGLIFWPVIVGLLVVRLATQGPWPERLLPTGFILVAPPAVIGLSLARLGAPPLVLWASWGMALIFLLWAALLVPRILKLPFALPHWSSSFPLAAFAGLTLQVSPTTAAMAPLALASIVVFGLSLATWRGLRAGTLLAPEPIASIQMATA